MKFIRLGDEIIRLDLVTHIKEGAKEETLYGRSVRKTVDQRFGWLEVHFVSGDVIKIEGEAANVLRKILEEEVKVRDMTPAMPMPPRKFIPPDPQAAEPTIARHDPAARSTEEHRPGVRNGFGR
jgi:hypothetical protein